MSFTTTAVADPSLLRHRRFDSAAMARRTLRFLTGAVLALAAAASVASAAYVVVERIGFAPVLSPSMQPAFGPGDLIVTRAEPSSTIRPGQVVVLPLPDAPGQRYVHRVIEVDQLDGKTVVRTKGDANAAPDANRLQITSRQVPVVVHSVPGAGRIGLVLRGSGVRIGLLAFTGLCALAAARRIMRGGR